LRYFLPAGLRRFAKEMCMSDKRKTPDPAVGAPRRKRSAPTIDLTATEVPPAAADSGQPSEPPPAHEQPEAVTEPETQPMADQASSLKQPAWLSVPALAGGVLGAALMAIVLGTLWFAGAVPVRYVASSDSSAQISAPDNRAVDAVAQRITRIEGALARLPANDPGVAERLSAVDNATKSLGIALTALNKRNDEIAGNAADARARADAAQNAMTQLRDSVQSLSKDAPATLSPADVDIVQKRLGALEQAVKAAPADNAARLALSAAALRDAVASGAPFDAELDEVRFLGADEKSLAPLAPFASSGAPTIETLAQELRALMPVIMKTSGTQAPAGNYLERLEASAARLVRIRPVGMPAGDDASAVLARVEKEAASAAIDDALTDLGKLDVATRAPAQSWIAKAQARQAAVAAARQLASQTAHALGKR
jgi:hypothetical protein